jgi:EAL domain-containing protein (putative c-di-GMP-specific phosphodiesterase class I)
VPYPIRRTNCGCPTGLSSRRNRARAAGKSCVESYDAAIDHAISDYHALNVDIVGAAERGRARQHPIRGFLPPSTFIALAEANGAIVDIGLWVLGAACAQMPAWQHRHGRPDLYLAVSVSGR